MIEARQKQIQLYRRLSAYRFRFHNGRSCSPVAARIHERPDSRSSVASGNNAFARLTVVASILSSCFGYRAPTPRSANTSEAAFRPSPVSRLMKYCSTCSVPPEVPGRENAGMSE